MKFNYNHISPESAEIAGLFAADGSMQRSHICFWGNPIEDKAYYIDYLPALFFKAFGIKIKPYNKKSNSVIGFYICNKEILETFQNILGFPIGSKTYSVKVPDIIFNADKQITRSFIRDTLQETGASVSSKDIVKDTICSLENTILTQESRLTA